MKKIVSILLCLVMCVFALVGCAEDLIGSYRDNYDYEEEVVEEITLNLYIIGDDSTAENAETAVKREISEYTKREFSTILNIFYISASEYESVIAEKTKANATDKADIVLVNSKEMMDSLVEGSRLADLTSFYKTKDFGKLNVTISSDVLEASKIDGKYYCVPNNHVVGDYNGDGIIGNYGYKYLVIDEQVARSLGFGDTQTLASYDSLEKFMAEGALGNALSCVTYDAENKTLECSCDKKCVEIVNAGYDAQKTFVENGKYFTVLETPTATADDVFESAFAVLSDTKDVSRAMEIIYAINMDSKLRNYLQYGLLGTNYEIVDGNIVRYSADEHPDNVYYMNILYTGNLFLASYCEEIGWTEAVADSANNQNNKKIIKQDIYQP